MTEHFPAPRVARQGWLWDRPSTFPTVKDESYPKVTVVSPSYNQAQFLEETIRSVLLQNYPNLEYIIVDGGSDDGSVEIIRKYETWLTFWVSEPDEGQADAINKGWRRATGDYVTWLNSDDLLAPDSLASTVAALEANEKVDIVYGDVLLIDEHSEPLTCPYHCIKARPFDLQRMVVNWKNPIPQQGFLMRRRLLQQIGYLDSSYDFTMDFEYWVRIALNGGCGQALSRVVGYFRHHTEAKSSTIQIRRIKDRYRIYDSVYGNHQDAGLHKMAALSRQHLDRQAAYVAYAAADAQMVRHYARQYLLSGGIRALPFVLLLTLMSVTGDSGLALLRRLYRSVRRFIARETCDNLR